MKKNNGFTLVELIAVITLLALIILVSVPVIINTLRKTEENEYEDFEKLVVNAAEIYLERNRDLYHDFDNVGDSIAIDVDTLINEGYLKSDLENPVNNESIEKYKVIVSIGQDEIFDYKIEK